MKMVLKIIVGLLIGIVGGLAVGAAISVLFTDSTFSEFADKMLSTDGVEVVVAAFVGILTFVIAIAVLIPIHEAGHLICGLLTGYDFVSFRIFSFTFIKIEGKIRVKKFAVAGTGGQCLLSPPDLPLEAIPMGWYNAGGVCANLLVLLLVLPLFLLNLHPLAVVALSIFCLTDLLLILLNGIPMKLNGISNDGYNSIYMGHNLLSKRAIVLQLRTNALIQNGMRPKDMPSEWFESHSEIDFKNPLEVSIPLMRASRLVDQMMWDEAYEEFSKLYRHKADIIQLYVNEIACELVFCALVTGRKEVANQLLDDNLREYIETYKKVMSSKLRILCSIALYFSNDKTQAEDIYRSLSSNQNNYLLQGEVKSDLAIMNWMLNENKHE